MQRRLSITTWALSALVLLLGGYVYLAEVRGGARQARAQKQLLPFPSESAAELVFERAGGRIVCRKEGDRWRVIAPIRTDADSWTIQRVLEDLEEARIERTVAEHPSDLAAFGLEGAPRVTVAAGDARLAIEVGATNPTGSYVFARRWSAEDAGERAPVLLVTQRLRSAAEKSLYDLRDKTVLDFSPDEVTAITFTNEGRRVRLVRESKAEEGAQPGWRLVEPFRARADRGLVERMCNLISYLRAEEFVSERPERLQRYGLAPAWGSVRFEFPGGRSETLLFGQQTQVGATTRHFARRPEGGPIFTINDNLPREARRSPREWRDRRVTDFVRSDVEQLRLISPQRAVVCVKVGKDGGVNWRLAEYAGRVAEAMDLGAAARLPTAQPADRDRVEELLGKLATLEVASFLDGASPQEPRFGLVEPQMKVVALNEAGDVVASVSFGRRSGARCYATGPHLGGVFLVSAEEAERFQIGVRELAARS